jgi:hypothetical protein
MEKRFKRIQIFVLIAISLFILVFPAYLRCTKLPQAKLVSSDLSFEYLDQEESLPDNEKELKLYGPSNLLVMFSWGIYLFGQTFHLFPGSFSLLQKASILRC